VNGNFNGDEARTTANDLFDLDPSVLKIDAHRLEDLGCNASALPNQPQEDLLGADKVVPQPTSLLLSQHDDFDSFFCEAFKHDGYYHLVRAGYGDSSTAKIIDCDLVNRGFSPLSVGYPTLQKRGGSPMVHPLVSTPRGLFEL
jgi:hypothetical protein